MDADEGKSELEWLEMEREANAYVEAEGHHYAAGTSEARMAICRLAGVPEHGEGPRSERVMEAMRRDDTYPFAAFFAIRYPGVDQATDRFQWSKQLASERMWTTHNRSRGWNHSWLRMTNTLASEPGAYTYLVDSPRLTLAELAKVEEVIQFNLSRSANPDREADMIALRQRIRDTLDTRRRARPYVQQSNVFDTLLHRTGDRDAMHRVMEFVHPSITGRVTERSRPLRTNGDVLREIAQQAAAAAHQPNQAPQALQQIAHQLEDLSSSLESAAKKARK